MARKIYKNRTVNSNGSVWYTPEQAAENLRRIEARRKRADLKGPNTLYVKVAEAKFILRAAEQARDAGYTGMMPKGDWREGYFEGYTPVDILV